MQWESFFGRFQFVCFVLIAYYPHISFQDCAWAQNEPFCNVYSGCIANSQCYCSNSAIECCYMGTTFPPFSYYNSAPITYITVWGTFTNIYDNAFYLLTTMEGATVCLQQQNNQPSMLTIYEDTFATMSPNGFTSLQFFYYNPINLNTISNNQDIITLLIQKANLGEFPLDSINHFPNLNVLDLSNNMIPTVQLNSTSNPLLQNITLNHNQINQIMVGGPSLSNVDVSYNQIVEIDANAFAGPALTKVDVSYNKIGTLAPNSFQSSSSSVTVTANNNSLISISINAFNFTSKSISIDVSNNTITSVDPGFSKWFQASTSIILDLSNNPLPCDSTIHWMGTFAICPPLQIILARTELCSNGEPVYDYLIPYAKCG